MNKMKKLLSVLLAVIMVLSSFTVLASAAGPTAYKTVDELNALSAYSPYGQVTRLSTEERASMIQDFLDTVLPGLNINMGTVLDVLGLTITINFTSVDNVCISLDSFKNTFDNWLFGLAAGIVNLGILEDLNFDTWNTGIDRATDAQLTFFTELLDLLANNSGVVYTVLSTGELDLGIVGGLLGGLDLSAVTDILGDLPGLIKGMLYGMMERKDDTTAEVQALDAAMSGDGNVENTLNDFVKNLFKDNRSTTTVKADANGNMTSKHTGMPTAQGTRYYYVQNGTTLTAYRYVDAAEAKASEGTDEVLTAYTYVEDAVYTLTQEYEGGEDYVWTAEDDWGNKWNLKYYEDDSQWIPSLTTEIDLSTMSLADLLYTFIPPVFADMAPVVLNGSLKKILGEFFGARYNYVGQVGEDAVTALADSSNTFFTEEQGEYLWEWSNYAVINDTHYYRFEDQIFVADISNVNNYFHIIDWGYEITGDFMDEFVPENGGSTSDTLLMNLNDFLIKVAEEVLVESAETTDSASDYTATWTRPTFTSGDNSNLVGNIKLVAQAIIGLAPQHIFGSDYATNERCYYNLMMSDDNDTVLTGIAAHLVNMIMPSMSLPGASKLVASNAKVGAILAAVIREFAAYLAPEYNYDALIYADFGTTTADPDKTFVDPETAGLVTDGQTASGYWLDVCLTMGLDVGYEYIRAFADLGEDTEYCAGAVNVGYGAAGKTYEAGTTQATLNAQWEGMLDYIIDFALVNSQEWTWKMENFVNTDGLTIDLATAQDPWVKLQQILGSILPVDEILNVTATDCETKMEQFLRYDFILAIVDLRWGDLADTLKVPDGFVRTDNVLDSLATVLKNLVNSLFAKIGGGSYALIPSAITDFDTLANQENIAILARDLIGALDDAHANGLLDTVFPFLNFLFGWKTDPQVIADPIVGTSFRDGNDYAFQWSGYESYPAISETKITFLNNSSGMLETHRDSTVVDHEYAIQITGVTSDATVNTLTFDYGDGYASPYETIEINVNGTYGGEEVITVTIAYEYLGKDGAGVGGTLYKNITFLMSNKYEDANVTTAETTSSSITRKAYNTYIFTEDIYGTVTSTAGTVSYKSTAGGNKDVQDYQAPAIQSTTQTGGQDTECDTSDDTYETVYYAYPDYDQYAQGGYFTYNTQDESGWATIETSITATTGSSAGKFFKAADGYDENSEYPTGIYAFQKCLVTYNSVQNIFDYVFIHYDDYDIYQLYTENKDRTVLASQVADEAVYTEWLAAWKDVVKYATYPLMTELNGNSDVDYLKVIMPAIPGVMERFEAADEALAESIAEANANAAGGADASLPEYIQTLETQLKTDDNYGEKEVNFQDYEFYEYFNYADLRTQARNLVKTYYAPEVLDQYFIKGWGIRQEELDQVIDAETNEAKNVAIKATRSEHDAAAIAASQEAHDNFVMPTNTKLYVDDITARLVYYKQFIYGHEEPTSHLYFLNQEIDHVEAQQLVEADYTEKSWEAYANALAEAKAVAAGTDEYSSYNSRIYDVKYNLMVAYKNLLLKADSLIEAGGTADLLANIAIAEEIFGMSYDEITLSEAGLALAEDPAEAKEIALGHLLFGLGYYYQGRYTSYDAEVKAGIKTAGELKVNDDGSAAMYNLYDNSAYEYADNDRPNRTSNQANVNACNNNLEACIAYFDLAEEMEPSTLMVEEGFEYADYVVIDTNNTNNGEYTGIVYGIDTLDQNEMMEMLATLDDALTTSNGDDYLVIEANEMGVESTGATITVVDENGEALETYVFVYFGDVDGDGMISSQDAFLVETYELEYIGIESYASFVAADVDGDGMATGQDAFLMETYELEYVGVDYQYNLGQTAMNNMYEWIY